MQRVHVTVVVVGLVCASLAHAQPPPSQPQPPTSGQPGQAGPAVPAPADAARLAQLEQENQDLKDRLDDLQDDERALEARVDKLAPLSTKLTGYADLGFFYVSGDGSGIRPDYGHLVFPQYSDVPDSWVFMGDPLSTAINSRGDPATTSTSRAVTFDPIKGHKATFLVNSIDLALFQEVGRHTTFTAKIDVLPRGRDVSDPDGLFLGDYIDARLAYVEYRIPGDKVKTSLFVGKFDSVVGFEYRSQEAPSRIEVTPSLICRYTCGYPIGLKARFELFHDMFTANVAVTNGGPVIEGFPFYDETDTNNMKTVSGRVSYRLPLGRDVEIGVSGVYGAQDNQPSDNIHQWMYGFDFHWQREDLVLRAEYVKGRMEGAPDDSGVMCGLAPCLRFQGAYGLLGYRVTNIVMPYVRADWRDALHRNGDSFVYISKLWRATVGIHLTLNPNLVIKAEYTLNNEINPIPQFPDDVFTSSMVVHF